MTWVERKTVTYGLEELPYDDEDKLIFIDPSIIRLHVPGYRYPVDIGSWCYTKRRKASLNCHSPRIAVQEVQPNSFRIQRVDFVRKFIEYLWQLQRMNKSPSTLQTQVNQLQRFLYWCNKEFVTALDSRECYANAIHQYTDEMIDKIRKSRLHINTAASRQQIMIGTGCAVYDDPYSDLFKSVRILRRSNAATNVTEKPDDETARRTYNVYMDLFGQLSDFVIDIEPFPKRIDLEHGYFWFFPTSLPFAGPSNVMSKEALESNFLCYDYINGTIRPLDEIKKLSKDVSPYRGNTNRKHTLKLIEEANRDPYHERRQMAAKLAFNAFIMMFSANTGMNLAQIISLPWTGEYEMGKQKQGFKTIKYRAHNREVAFFITNNFLPVFKKCLRLRSYILNSLGITDFEYLFFSVVNQTLRKLNDSLSTEIHVRLKNSFDFKDKVTTRMWRSFKSDWLIRKSGIPTASLLLQNAPTTLMKHYAEGSQYESEQELTKFFSEYENTLLISASSSSIPIAAGQCLQLDPVAIPFAPIKPNCSLPEGCLYCEKFRVNADETDYKKLLSFRYVLEFSKTLAHDEEHYQRVVSPTIERIDEVKSQILDSGILPSEIVKRITIEVYQYERLDKYWQKKLDLLDDLGAF